MKQNLEDLAARLQEADEATLAKVYRALGTRDLQATLVLVAENKNAARTAKKLLGSPLIKKGEDSAEYGRPTTARTKIEI